MPMKFANIAIVIPAYQPSTILIQLVKDLLAANYRNIVVVNDGSDVAKQPIFDEVRKLPHVTVIDLPQNRGKGEGIKTGLRYILKNQPNIMGVITADADGQHLPQDIKKMGESLLANPNKLILGIREFNNTVPFRSRFGNTLTRWLFHFRYKVDIQDTQTGLRGIPIALLPAFVAVTFSGYEFEMACLIQAVKSGFPIEQVKVSTVYLNRNVDSHFNPVIDSVRIYYVFLRYAAISFISYLIDFSFFVIFYLSFGKIFLSLLLARIISSTFNFYQNKFLVFRSQNLQLLKFQIVSYIALAIMNLLLAYLGIFYFVSLGMHVFLAKILVDAVLFILVFLIQKKLVFRV